MIIKYEGQPPIYPGVMNNALFSLMDFEQIVCYIAGKRISQFGSYARGDYTSGSDIDLLLLLDGVDDPDVERERYSRTICDLSLKYDTVVSVIPMDYKRYLSRKTPLILNARKEGMRI